YLAEVDGEIAGYASLVEGEQGQQGEGYLDLLNVNPKFHGLHIGRKLVQTCVNRAIQEGFKRHTLGTWSNNLKAVPVYKKTGHFWRPQSSVWMQNYVPMVVQMPICRPFFERHDWYDSHVRQVTQDEDDFRWEGVKVYPMRWEADGESLAVWIDREAQAPVAVETDELFVAAIPQRIEALHGDQVQINWRITNKTDTVQRFLVDARGANGLEIDHREMFVVQPGATVEHVAMVNVTESTPYGDENGDAPAVRSVITFGHDDVELFSGIRARKPFEISTDSAELSIAPRRSQSIQLQLQNRRDVPIEATVRLTPSDGLVLSWVEREVEIEANGDLALPVVVTSAQERAYRLEVRAQVGDQAKPVIETLTLFSVGPGGLVWQADAKSVRIETDAQRVKVEAKRGVVTLIDKATAQFLASVGPTMGPPYHSTEALRRVFDVSVEPSGSRVVVALSAESMSQPGLVLVERLTVAPTGLIEVSGRLENRGIEIRESAVRLVVERGDLDRLKIVMPLAKEVVVGDASWWPRVPGDMPSSPHSLAEPWQIWQGHGQAAGVAWGSGVEQLRSEWRFLATGAPQSLAPGESSSPVTLALCGQEGDWPQVRSRLCAWAGVAPKPLPVQPMALASVDPSLIVTDQARVQAEVNVKSVLSRAFDGEVTLTCAAPCRADWTNLAVPHLVQGALVSKPVSLTLPDDEVSVYAGEAQLELPILHSSTPFHIVRAGLGGPVSVAQERDRGYDTWCVDNGLAQFRIVAGYGPSVYSWRVNGQEQLHSHFPETHGLAWVYPFFGGIYPLLMWSGAYSFDRLLYRAPCAAMPVEQTDRWGLNWQGMRLAMRPEQEELRALLVELDVLTLGRSPILKIVQRLRNERNVARELISGLAAMPSLGAASVQDLVLAGPDAWHQDSPIGNSRWGQRWGAVVNPADGRTALLVSNEDAVGLWATAQAGRLFWGGRTVRLAAKEVQETTYYLVLANSLEEAKRFVVLQDA
ncbi:MAG: GNAT family N-acetyltransferase, partial [Anaerolineales bacterium]